MCISPCVQLASQVNELILTSCVCACMCMCLWVCVCVYIFVQLASQVNELILTSENQKPGVQLNSIYKLMLWTQQELDQKKVLYNRMTDISKGSTESSSSQ